MHDTSFENLELFTKTYLSNFNNLKVVDVGSRLRTQEKKVKWRRILEKHDYIGVDIVDGYNVDLVIEDPYIYPFESNSIDVIIKIVFLNIQNFWELFIELIRILKPSGLLYINAPSNGDFTEDCLTKIF